MPEKHASESEVVPVSIERAGEAAIKIRWSDDTETNWTASELRKACPCATCREKRQADEPAKDERPPMLPVLSAAEAKPLRIDSMSPVGSYAYSIGFSDGHSSGIFPFAMLKDK